jgi:hypothetical protein
MIDFARWEMRGELIRLWQVCFNEPVRFPRYFMNNIFSPENCLVYQTGGTIAAAVHLVPAQIVADGSIAQAHYIFAAATLQQYRSRGYMASLLAYAAIAGARRGDRFSAVLPADDGLIRYYAAQGYQPFFRVRTLEVPRERLEREAEAADGRRLLPDCRQLGALRNGVLCQSRGSLLWSAEQLRTAAGMHGVYGDRLICSVSEGGTGFALCRPAGEQCEVLETMCTPESFGGLAGELLRGMPAQAYQFRLPAATGPFEGEGKISEYGMIRPLGGALPEEIASETPYLGFAMD